MHEELIEKSNLMKEKRQRYLIECLNPHEKEMMSFIDEVIEKCNITNLDEWIGIEYLIPDCVSRLLIRHHYEKLAK